MLPNPTNCSSTYIKIFEWEGYGAKLMLASPSAAEYGNSKYETFGSKLDLICSLKLKLAPDPV